MAWYSATCLHGSLTSALARQRHMPLLPSLPRRSLKSVKAAMGPSERGTASTVTQAEERSEVDKLVDGLSFGQLCDEFQCISSPAVEATAKQLARDIFEMKESKRALNIYSVSVKYEDPLRSFTGREKYNRQSWMKIALQNPSVAVREMEMLSTSVLNVKWVLQGRPSLFPASLLGDLVIVAVDSTFTMNQISGQVVQHTETWDLSCSSIVGQAYFWSSRLAYVTSEAGKDAAEAIKSINKVFENKDKDGDSSRIFSDLPTDPTKFLQVDENPQRDLYQIALFIALLYLLVQFLRLSL